jgi:hypothetical protein
MTSRDPMRGLGRKDSELGQGTGARKELADIVQQAGDSLLQLGGTRGEDLAGALARLLNVVADEAVHSRRFAAALRDAITVPSASDTDQPRRPHRRASGVLDPFTVFGEVGVDGLRTRLAELDLEQLRDIVAEHGMDNDRLAMKWKDPNRVIDRIVERVAARLAKGSAFRAPSSSPAARAAAREHEQQNDG